MRRESLMIVLLSALSRALLPYRYAPLDIVISNAKFHTPEHFILPALEKCL